MSLRNTNERRSNVIFGHRNEQVPCNCGWEVRFGYGVAVTLAIFEAKRFFMLILEIFAEWQIIRFAGGSRPVALTLADVTIGLPTALIAVRTIRSQKVRRCYVRTDRTLRCLLLVTAICATLNATTLISIGCHISVKQEALIGIFNSSMRLYVNAATYKYAIDEIQFIFQCCGHTSYRDWFLFDWQRVDYASRDEMELQNIISDEEYRDRAVPFSCCSLRVMRPCVYTEILESDVRTINTNGCAEIVSPILLRIVIVAYVMTSTLLITQILLTFLITKIIKKLLIEAQQADRPPLIFANGIVAPRHNVTNSDTERQKSSVSSSNSETGSPKFMKKSSKRGRPTKRIKRVAAMKSIRSRNQEHNTSSDSSISQCRSSSPRKLHDETRASIIGAAKIKPSIHEEHTISKKRLYNKGTR